MEEALTIHFPSEIRQMLNHTPEELSRGGIVQKIGKREKLILENDRR